MLARRIRQSLVVLFLAGLLGCNSSGSATAQDGGATGGGTGGATGGGTGGAAGGGTGGAAGGGTGGAAGAGGAGGTTGGGGAGGGAGASGGAAGAGDAAGAGGAGGPADPRCQGAWAGDLLLGTTEDDQILGMTVDADDNLIVSGYEHGIVGVSATNIDPDGDARAVVMKLSPAGTTLWKTVLDTAATDSAEDVAIDPVTGNLVVVGRTSGAFPTFVNQGQFDFFVALLDPTGQTSTVFETGNERPQHPVRLSLGPGGDVLVAGWDDTYIPSNYVAANQDGFIAHFGIDPGPGHAVSLSSLVYAFPPAANAPFSAATAVAAERDGSGASYLASLIPSNGTQHGIVVTKFRADQTPVWDDAISNIPFDAVTALALSPAGELFATGGTFATLGARAFGQEDAYLQKIDKATGTPIWTAQAGGPDSDYPTALAFDVAGNVYVAGITLGSVVDGLANKGQADIFAMKFSAAGALLGVWQRGTASDDELTSMAVDGCDNVFVGGYTRGALVAGHPPAGGEDMFIMKVEF
jgi:hypothetical protein